MKQNLLACTHIEKGIRRKIALIMKWSFFFLFVCAMHISAKVHSQTKLTLRLQKATFSKLFLEIEKKTGYRFLFDDGLLPKGKTVDVNVKDEEVKALLDAALSGTGLAYRISNDDLIIISAAIDEKRAGDDYKVVEITGRITDTSGQPITGASVIEKGTKNGTSSGIDGSFKLQVSGPDAVLVISSIGFTQREITVGSQTNLTISLVGESREVEQVVVIGYQTVRKKDLTGATSVVNAENTDKLAARSLPEQLQGMSPGLNVRTGGQPGQEAVVNIRGIGTINGSANPLYIIDGMFADPNTTVNPDDVATIQVLKDASAAAIYGSRAANGVIIITTKKGREGAMKVSASGKYSFTSIPTRYKMMDGPTYVATNKAAYQAAGYALQPSVANYDGTNTNWADEALRTGNIQDYNVTLSGGSKTSTYLFSGSYFKDNGTLIARNFERSSFRINTESTRGRFKFGENVMLSNSYRNSPYENNFEVGNPWYDIFNNLPIIPVRSPALVSAANPGGWGYGSNNARTFSRNPVAIADITSAQSNFFKILGNAYAEFRFADWLNYRFNAGIEASFDRTTTLRKDGPWYWNQSPKPSEIGENRGRYWNYLFEHTLNFNKTFDRHTINGVIGFTQQTTKGDNSFGGRTNLAVYNGVYFTTITTAGGAGIATGGNYLRNIQSILGRLNYNYADRYLATFTFRSDEDSRFSPNYRTGFFPSGALGWNIHNESFFSSNFVSTLKLRGSYGVLGASNLGDYQFQGFLNQGPRYIFGSGQTEVLGATQARLSPSDLRWEKKTTTNIGVDAGFLSNRITVSIDAFRSVSSDVLVQQPLPSFLGNLGGDPLVNIGSIENKGIELEAMYRHNNRNGFSWNISGNVAFIRNRILSLGNLGISTETGQPTNYIQSGNTRSQVGRALGEYYVLRTNGIFQTQKEIDDHKAQARYAKPGDIRYVNTIDGGTNDDINDRDRQFAGSPWPKLTTGVQFNSSYKNLTLTVQLYGAFGQKLYNDVRRDLDGLGYSNYRVDINPWTPTNTSATMPRLGVSYATGVAGDPQVDQGIISNVRGNTDRWIEDGSYLRLRNVELGYMLPKGWLSPIHFSNARLFVSGQNLVTFTKYSGLDPDVVGGNANLEPGVDYGNYPASRIVTVGLNIGF